MLAFVYYLYKKKGWKSTTNAAIVQTSGYVPCLFSLWIVRPLFLDAIAVAMHLLGWTVIIWRRWVGGWCGSSLNCVLIQTNKWWRGGRWWQRGRTKTYTSLEKCLLLIDLYEKRAWCTSSCNSRLYITAAFPLICASGALTRGGAGEGLRRGDGGSQTLKSGSREQHLIPGCLAFAFSPKLISGLDWISLK